jgi:hypothetical protein
MAILTDKSGVLEEAARREEERQVRIAERQAQLLVAVIEQYFEAVGLTLGPAASRPSPTCSARPRMALRRRRRPRRRRRGQTSGARSAAGWTLGRRGCPPGRDGPPGFAGSVRRRRRPKQIEIVAGRQHAPAVERRDQVRSGRSAAGPTQRRNARPVPFLRPLRPPFPARRSGRQLAPSAGLRSGWQDLGNVTHRPILPKVRDAFLRNGPRLSVVSAAALSAPRHSPGHHERLRRRFLHPALEPVELGRGLDLAALHHIEQVGVGFPGRPGRASRQCRIRSPSGRGRAGRAATRAHPGACL